MNTVRTPTRAKRMPLFKDDARRLGLRALWAWARDLLLMSIRDKRMSTALRLADLRLQSANEELRQLAFLDRDTQSLCESQLDVAALEQLGLQNDLRHAIALGQLQLHYQPKVSCATGQAQGVEALLRWNHPERGTVSPAVFIPIAERFGLINALGQWVIEEACRQTSVWARDGVHLRVAINLSVHQLREQHIVQRIDEALRRHGVAASQLLCEITESTAIEEIKHMHRTFDGFARIGVCLSIDDFGTGYSSLSYLLRLPASELKIDRSFIAELDTSKEARAIVSAIIRLAHELGLSVVAEGVETQAQRALLRSLGCDELQGYDIARPMSADALQAWIERQTLAWAADLLPLVVRAESLH